MSFEEPADTEAARIYINNDFILGKQGRNIQIILVAIAPLFTHPQARTGQNYLLYRILTPIQILNTCNLDFELFNRVAYTSKLNLALHEICHLTRALERNERPELGPFMT